jgi:hypothetical protein
MDGFAVKVTTTAEAVKLLPDLDDFFLIDLRFDSGVRRLDDGSVVFGEPTVLARLNREGTWVGLVFQSIERYEVGQEHVREAVEVQESRGMLDIAILGLQVRCFRFYVLMNPAADFPASGVDEAFRFAC